MTLLYISFNHATGCLRQQVYVKRGLVAEIDVHDMTEVKSQGGVSKEQTFAQAVARAAAAQLPAFKWPVARDMTTLLTLQSILGSVLDHAIPEEERTQRATLSKVNELYTVPLDLSGRDWDTVLNVLQARNGVYHGHPYLVSDFEDDMVILEKQVLALTNEWSAADKTTLVRFYLLIEEFPRKWSVIAQEANNAERPPTWQQIARVFPELAQFGQESSNIVNVGRFLELGSKPGLGALYKPLLGTTKRTPKQVAQDFAPSLQTRPSSVAPMRASTTTVVPVSVTAPLAASVASTASMAAASAMSLGGRSSPRSVDEFSSRAAAAFEIDLDNLSRLLNESKAAQLGAKDLAQTTADWLSFLFCACAGLHTNPVFIIISAFSAISVEPRKSCTRRTARFTSRHPWQVAVKYVL
jgi:hypothetical protein